MLIALVSGILTGLLYAISGLGLVVVYRASRVLNFALGGVGALAAYSAVDMLGNGVPSWVAFLAAILVGALASAILEVAVVGPLSRRTPIIVGIATLGALLIFEGFVGFRYGYLPRALPPMLGNQAVLQLGSVVVTANQAFSVACAVAAIALIFLLLNRTKLGLGMRAASSGPYTAELMGINVARTRLTAWAVGGAYGALAALLVAPTTYLSPDSFTMFLLATFTAAVLGGFSNIKGVILGGLVYGVAVNILVLYLDSSLVTDYMHLVVTVVLIFRPNGLLGSHENDVAEPDLASASGRRPAPELPGTSGVSSARLATTGKSDKRSLLRRTFGQSSSMMVALALLALCPLVLGDSNLYLLTTAAITFIGVLGLNILVGYTGQISLSYGAFLAVGAYSTAILQAHGVDLWIAIVLSMVIAGVGGILLGLPAVRLEGLYLAVLTLMFAAAVPQLLLYFKGLTGGSTGLSVVLPPWMNSTKSLFWFIFAIAVVIALIIGIAAVTRPGRAWRAVRDSEPAARSLGVSPRSVKLWAFALGSMLAGLSGALGALQVGVVGPDNYGVFVSIYALVAVIIGGNARVVGSLLGAVFITFVPSLSNRGGFPPDIVMGVLLIAVLLFVPGGIVDIPHRVMGVVRTRRTRTRKAAQETDVRVTGTQPVGDVAEPADALLSLRGLSAGYGRVGVLRDVTLRVETGEVVAVLGANGAGKSTLLRAISGAIPLTNGTVAWGGSELSRRQRPHTRSRMGISHVPEGRGIFPDLTVEENLMIARFSLTGSKISRSHLKDHDALRAFPILNERMGQRAGTLSGGQQQMLAIARALLAEPKLLMLDEPLLGLAPVVRREVLSGLSVIAKTGVSILIVEQNARAALQLADRGYVLSHGVVLFSDTSANLQQGDRLERAYLTEGRVR